MEFFSKYATATATATATAATTVIVKEAATETTIATATPKAKEQLQSEDWHTYGSEFQRCLQDLHQDRPGAFALCAEERAHRVCRICPIPRDLLPLLRLPLRFVLVRDEHLGCSVPVSDIPTIAEEVNQYWKQAGITFTPLLAPVEVSYPGGDVHGRSVVDLKTAISSLCRGDDGRMTEKTLRRRLFLEHIMKDPHFDPHTAFNVWILDFIGQESQGVCIDRGSHSIIIGQRSNKGYPEVTVRSLPCLSKTIAHELGHALGLDHPGGGRFSDGDPLCGYRRNLMTGGVDKRGGGGYYLEDWQIVLTRDTALSTGMCHDSNCSSFLGGCGFEKRY